MQNKMFKKFDGFLNMFKICNFISTTNTRILWDWTRRTLTTQESQCGI